MLYCTLFDPPSTALMHPNNWKNTFIALLALRSPVWYMKTSSMKEHRKADPRLQLVVAGRLVLAASARTRLVDLGRDGERDARKLLLLLIVVLSRGRRAVLLEPFKRLLDRVEDRLLVLVVELATETVLIVDLGLEAEGVVLEGVARLNALALGLVLLGKLLGCKKLASLPAPYPSCTYPPQPCGQSPPE